MQWNLSSFSFWFSLFSFQCFLFTRHPEVIHLWLYFMSIRFPSWFLKQLFQKWECPFICVWHHLIHERSALLSALVSVLTSRCRQTNCKHCSVTWPTLNPDWPVPLNLALAATVLVCDVMCLFLKLCGFQLVLGRLQIESNSGGSCGTSQFDLERWNVCKQSRLSGSFCRSCLCRTSVMNRANPELTDNTTG